MRRSETAPFAKLFETKEYGQILVISDQDDEGNPALKIMCQLPHLGALATVTSSFDDKDSGYDKRDEGFAKINEEMAVKMVADLRRMGE
jgi:hypothetical protein